LFVWNAPFCPTAAAEITAEKSQLATRLTPV
jgi:hypothetical protein